MIQQQSKNQLSLNQRYQPRQVQNKADKLSLKVAFGVFFRYLGYEKQKFLIAFFFAVLATSINVTVIVGISDLTDLIYQFIQNRSNATTELNYFFAFAGGLLVGYFCTAIFLWITFFCSIKLSENIGARLRFDLFHKIQSLSMRYFDSHKSGDTMSVIINDVYYFVVFISQNLGNILYGLITMSGMLIIMFLISPYLGLVIMGVISCIMLFLGFFIKKSGGAFLKQQSQIGVMNGFAEEMISGQNIISLFDRQDTVIGDFNIINKDLTKYGQTAQRIAGLLIPWLILLMNLTIAVLLIVGILFIANNIDFGSVLTRITLIPNNMNPADLPSGMNTADPLVLIRIGALTSLMLATRNFIQPINVIVASISTFQSAVAAIKRVNDIFIQPEEVQANETVLIDKPLQGKVEIKNLNFAYQPNKLVLKNINMSVNPGESVAIVGPTGSGKTTIINLLTKFYDITDGDIFIDGYDIKKLSKASLRKQVSVVFQDNYFFSGTIKENLQNAKPEATDEEIIAIAKLTGSHDFISNLADGYDTLLHENAAELSVGQKQLLAITMAMLANHAILIFDEATSNVDTMTEKMVQQAVAKLLQNRTSFLIAHRLSTVRHANKIIVLKDGEIIETGNHEELMALQGFYWRLNVLKIEDLDH